MPQPVKLGKRGPKCLGANPAGSTRQRISLCNSLLTRSSGRNIDAVLVIDADTLVEPNLVAECKRLLASGADGSPSPVSVEEPGPVVSVEARRTRCAGVQPPSSSSSRMVGGICRYSGKWICAHQGHATNGPISSASGITEDLEYHLALIKAGRRMQFTDATTVRSDLPTEPWRSDGSTSDGGRAVAIRLMMERVPRPPGEGAQGAMAITSNPCSNSYSCH